LSKDSSGRRALEHQVVLTVDEPDLQRRGPGGETLEVHRRVDPAEAAAEHEDPGCSSRPAADGAGGARHRLDDVPTYVVNG